MPSAGPRRSPERVVSLLASSTETVCALGFGDRLVGRSHECDHPDWVRRLPVLTEPKIRPGGTPAEVDRDVKALLREGLSVYRVDVEALRRLEPDLILTQDQCEVCAVSLRDVEKALSDWFGAPPEVVSLRPDSLEDAFSDMVRVAEALGDRELGEALVEELLERMEAVSERATRLPERPRIAAIEWIEPLMAAGNWMPELVEMAGGRNLFGEAGRPAPLLAWRTLVEEDPDVLVVCPCGLSLAEIRSALPALERLPGFAELGAVRAGRVALADGNAYFNRPGPRLAESLEILAEILHPETFDFGHRGSAWEPLCPPTS
jgi:iron complex transport system substrate-binding protein